MISPIFGQLWDEPWLNVLQVSIASGSLVLNGILLLANYRRGEMRWATDGIMCTITGLADCNLALYVVLSTAARTFDGTILYDNSLWCRINYVIGRSMCLVCLDVAALLSLIRYLVIVRGHGQHPLRWTCVAITLSLFLAATTFEHSLNSDIYVFPSKLYCSPIKAQETILTIALSAVIQIFALAPLFVIPFCYARVSSHYARLASQLNAQINLKIVGIVVMACAYVFSVTPDYIVFGLLNYFHILPTSPLTGLASCLSGCVSLINALFPLLYHDEIRQHSIGIFSSPKPQ